MEDNAKLLEDMLKSATDYGTASIELIKLKAVSKTANAASFVMSHSFVLVFIASFMLFLNFGLALWLGDLLGQIYWGFMIVAALYGLVGLLLRFVFFGAMKRKTADCFIKTVLE